MLDRLETHAAKIVFALKWTAILIGLLALSIATLPLALLGIETPPLFRLEINLYLKR